MTSRCPATTSPAMSVVDHFDGQAAYWHRVYSSADVHGDVYRRRELTTLDWVDHLGLSSGVPVLDAGCGAGGLTLALAEREYLVTALDAAPAMLERTRRRVKAAGLESSVSLVQSAADRIGMRTAAFDLVTALGLLPWLRQPEAAMREMARVLKPGGWLVMSADNRRGLHRLVDPLLSPPLARGREWLRGGLAAVGLRRSQARAPRAALHTFGQVRKLLAAQGLGVRAEVCFGFGPFSLLGRDVIPGHAGRLLNHALEGWSSDGARPLSGMGSQYLVLACKTVDSR